MKVDSLIKIIERERNSRVNKSNPSSKFIYQAYNNVISRLNENFNTVETITDAKIQNLLITENMKEKLKKMLGEGLGKKSDDLLEELVNYMGLGKIKAKNLIDQGLTSIDQVYKKPWFDKLPLETRTTLKNVPVRKIPREILEKLEDVLTGVSGLKAVIVGSYRRKTAFSRDIDIMLVSDKKDAIKKYLDFLTGKLIKVVVYSLGSDKMSLVFKSVETRGKFYKIDVFLTSKEYEAAMLLYSTGSKAFNIKMRAKAKAAGYLLNQMGLYDKKTGDKVLIKNEKGFFSKLNMVYVPPEKR